MRQLAAFEEAKPRLEELEVSVIAACSDDKERVEEVIDRFGLTYPVAYGVSRSDADIIGSWWSDDRDGFIEPTEMLLGRGGLILGAMYASGPLGRMSADEIIYAINARVQRRLQYIAEAEAKKQAEAAAGS